MKKGDISTVSVTVGYLVFGGIGALIGFGWNGSLQSTCLWSGIGMAILTTLLILGSAGEDVE